MVSRWSSSAHPTTMFVLPPLSLFCNIWWDIVFQMSVCSQISRSCFTSSFCPTHTHTCTPLLGFGFRTSILRHQGAVKHNIFDKLGVLRISRGQGNYFCQVSLAFWSFFEEGEKGKQGREKSIESQRKTEQVKMRTSCRREQRIKTHQVRVQHH